MDQDNSKGQDKRNWRERLGIGAQGGKDLPKISDDYRKEPAPVATRPAASARPVASARPAPRVVTPAVKPAPMAPRANPKPIAPTAASPDKLAERLRSQREASTKLAEQRVLVAKQRAEAQIVPPPTGKPPVTSAPKPKFAFAEENNSAAPAPQVAAPAARPAAPPPQVPQPQLSPARPPLGGAGVGVPPPAFQPRPQQPFAPLPQYQQSPQAPIGYQPQYNQQPVPPYRPIDPNSGFAPPPGYVPQQRGFTPPPGQFIPPQNSPRLSMPPRGASSLNPNYQPQQDFGAPQQPGFNAMPPRVGRPQMRAPAPPPQQDEGGYDEEYDDQASALGNRRPSTNDYQQAYREAEYGYEDEAPRSRAPWILASLLLLALAVAGVGVWLYLSSVRPLMTGQPTTEQVPAVAAPETPAKVQAEPAAGEATTRSLDAPSKKKIYDRIVGDQEVLGGELAPAIETPAAIPEPVNEAAPPAPAAAEPAGSGGEEAAPLPIPPPPGEANDQQGSLAPDNAKQSAENISPAAGESQAAVAAPGASEPVASQAIDAPPAPSAVEVAPVPGELKRLASEPAAEENIEDAAPAPIVKKKAAAKPKADEEKKVASRTLGSKPVVLVPPAKKTTASSKKPKLQDNADEESIAATDGGGLYGGTDFTTANTAPAPAVTAPAKKKKTLADLFRGEDSTPEPAPAELSAASEPKPVAPVKPTKKLQAAAPEQQASLGGFAVQLASFRSRNEAQTEFGRLKAKHSGALGGFSPIISEAQVGGSTRFRLSVGGMNSQAQASAVCSKLFAGGERDCLVKRR